MINENIYSCYNTDTEAFKTMAEILGKAMFREKFDGAELHHIVPVTWFAQNDETRPSWASISDWGKLIRNSDEHPANNPLNLVYLTKEEHEHVHQLMQQCWGNNEIDAPSKGVAVYGFNRINSETGEILQHYDSCTEASKWLIENGYAKSEINDERVACPAIYWASKAGVTRYGFKWCRA